MDTELKCDFYIGDRVSSPMKKMSYSALRGFKNELKRVDLKGAFFWQKGAIKTVFSNYNTYILTGDPNCISTWIILLFTKFTSKKTFLWTHGWYGKETGVKKLLKKFFYKLSDNLLLYGDYARNLMLKEGFKPEKLHCIYNSLDYDNQLNIRRQLKITNIFVNRFGNSNPALCYIGRIQKVKKIDMAFEAMRILKDNFNMDINFVIIGKESEEIDLRSLASESNLDDNVWFYGPCYDESMLGEIFYNSSLCVSPGNVGLTAVHSLTYGCPLITHDNFKNQMPEFEVIQPGVTGDFFEEDNVEDLANKIYNWLTLNPVKGDNKINACYKVIDERYNPHFQIELLKGLINE